jgi:hypothetical protein
MKAFSVFRYKGTSQATIPAEDDLDAVSRSKMFEDCEKVHTVKAEGLRAAIVIATMWENGSSREVAVGAIGW